MSTIFSLFICHLSLRQFNWRPTWLDFFSVVLICRRRDTHQTTTVWIRFSTRADFLKYFAFSSSLKNCLKTKESFIFCFWSFFDFSAKNSHIENFWSKSKPKTFWEERVFLKKIELGNIYDYNIWKSKYWKQLWKLEKNSIGHNLVFLRFQRHISGNIFLPNPYHVSSKEVVLIFVVEQAHFSAKIIFFFHKSSVDSLWHVVEGQSAHSTAKNRMLCIRTLINRNCRKLPSVLTILEFLSHILAKELAWFLPSRHHLNFCTFPTSFQHKKAWKMHYNRNMLKKPRAAISIDVSRLSNGIFPKTMKKTNTLVSSTNALIHSFQNVKGESLQKSWIVFIEIFFWQTKNVEKNQQSVAKSVRILLVSKEYTVASCNEKELIARRRLPRVIESPTLLQVWHTVEITKKIWYSQTVRSDFKTHVENFQWKQWMSLSPKW